MNQLKDAKMQYDQIEIPPELNQRIQSALMNSSAKQAKSKSAHPHKKYLFMATAAAAAALVLFTTAINTNTVFAEELYNLPIIGTIARVLTLRSYETENENLKISVEIPTLEFISQKNGNLSDAINKEILTLCEQYVENATRHAEEYKKAFMETGGTEEEWAMHNLGIHVSYTVKSQSDQFLSFMIEGSENWNSSSYEKKYYNLDLLTENFVSLHELLGDNYIQIANESIQQQITEREAQGSVFFSAEEGGFTSIAEDTAFYISETGNPVIVFDKYAIAPGSEGQIEFEIAIPQQH